MIQIPGHHTFDRAAFNSIVRALTDEEAAALVYGRLAFKPCFDLAGFDDEPKPLAKTKPPAVDFAAVKEDVLSEVTAHPNQRSE